MFKMLSHSTSVRLRRYYIKPQITRVINFYNIVRFNEHVTKVFYLRRR